LLADVSLAVALQFGPAIRCGSVDIALPLALLVSLLSQLVALALFVVGRGRRRQT
jgi:hypothetical protein